MSVFLKGIDINQFRTILAYAIVGANDITIGNDIKEVIEVFTPHGDLIDRNAFMKEHKMAIMCEDCERDGTDCCYPCYTIGDVCSMIEDAPTVIESEE